MHKPTDILRGKVEAWVIAGFKQTEIAERLGITDKTLRQHYREQLDQGKMDNIASAAAMVVEFATGRAKSTKGATNKECLTAAFFFLKTQAGWRETANVNLTAGGGEGHAAPPEDLDIEQNMENVLLIKDHLEKIKESAVDAEIIEESDEAGNI